MTSGDNSFNYFPENQVTKFIAVRPKMSMTQRASFSLGWTPLVGFIVLFERPECPLFCIGRFSSRQWTNQRGCSGRTESDHGLTLVLWQEGLVCCMVWSFGCLLMPVSMKPHTSEATHSSAANVGKKIVEVSGEASFSIQCCTWCAVLKWIKI